MEILKYQMYNNRIMSCGHKLVLAEGKTTMSLTINHPEADKLAHELISYTGETLTQAVLNALRERLKQEKAKRQVPTSLKDELLEIGRACAALPVLDARSPEAILGYNEVGVTG